MVIEEAILHIMDIDNESVIFTTQCLDLSQTATFDYVMALLQRLCHQDAKSGQIDANSPLATCLTEAPDDFVSLSIDWVSLWHDVSRGISDLPTGDYLVVAFEDGGQHYKGMIKLPHKTQMTHMVDYDDTTICNRLLPNRTILPTPTSQLEEAILVDNKGYYRLIEKRYDVDGKKSTYLSERVLGIQTPKRTINDSLKEVKKVVASIGEDLNEETFETTSRLQEAVYSTMAQGVLDVDRIGKDVFSENRHAQQRYQDKIKEKELVTQPVFDNERLTKRYEKQKFKLDNGIEISIPMDVYQNKEAVEFINHPDGSFSVMIKHVEEIKNKF